MTANEKLSIMLKERGVNHGLRNAVDNSSMIHMIMFNAWAGSGGAHYWVIGAFKWIIVRLKKENSHFCHFTW